MNMKRRLWKAVLALLLLGAWTAPTASANSAQSHWSGTDRAGAIVTDETCPLEVEGEKLTFEVQEFPRNYYNTMEEFLAYTGRVTAEYTFYNPADYTVTATLVFPFGAVPDYGYFYDDQLDTAVCGVDGDKYDITVDGIAVEKRLRHTLAEQHDQFDLERDMALLHDGYVDDPFYTPDLTVRKYTYQVSGVDSEAYPAATAAFLLNADRDRTRVLLMEQTGGKTREEGVLADTWAGNGERYTVYCFGEPVGELDWRMYENGACEKEIDGSVELVDTATMTFKELALADWKSESGVLEQDWYNAFVEDLNRSEWSCGVVSGSDIHENLSDVLMRWYEYELTVEPGERVVNTVTAPIYPAINTNYDPSIYTYTYLLSPAQTWRSFGTLDIRVNTPYFITESSLKGFEKGEEGYTLSVEGLPEGELVFVLSTDEHPVKELPNLAYLVFYLPILLPILAVILIPVVAIVILVRRRRKRL